MHTEKRSEYELKRIDEQKKKMDEFIRKQDLIDNFSKFDCNTISKMSNSELAEWQSNYPTDSPHYIFALQEWNNRSISRQLKWVKYSAILGPIATILAGIISFMAGSGSLTNKSQQHLTSIQAQYTTKAAIVPLAQNQKRIESIVNQSAVLTDRHKNTR